MPGTAQPRAIRTGPPTWCHRPQQLQRPVAQRIQNLSHRRRRAGGGRNHFPTAHRRIGRIADNDVNGQALNAWGNAQENVHVHRD